MSLAVFALVVVIWVALLVPIARRGRAELAADASEGGTRLSSGGARPWTTGDLPGEPTDEELAAAAEAARQARRRGTRRRAAPPRRPGLRLLVLAPAARSPAGAVLGGRWWLAAGVAGLLLAGYSVTLVGLGRRRSRRRRSRAAARPGRTARWAPPATWGGQVPVSSE